ncbi:MAG: TerC/Alx family metal homeostasis membrane protein, partial [Sciscionella sp.]
MMNVPVWAWVLTVALLLTLLAADLVIVDRKPHRMRPAECVRWLTCYVVCAAVFACLVWLFAGTEPAGQFVAGYLTEYSLSADNLFVFVLIIARFSVPKIHEHRVLLFGLLLALLVRSLAIAVGAVAMAEFNPVFYLFGAFLLYTAISTARSGNDDEAAEPHRDPLPVRLLRRKLPIVEEYHGARATVKIGGKRYLTPMLLVIVVIGCTDVLFALDSIPAVFGITKDAYLVFTANAFALMGLRQLYFLLSTLLRTLVYLPYGLA